MEDWLKGGNVLTQLALMDSVEKKGNAEAEYFTSKAKGAKIDTLDKALNVIGGKKPTTLKELVDQVKLLDTIM